MHRVFGLSNEDYDYRGVNKFVPISLKSFVEQVWFELARSPVVAVAAILCVCSQCVCSPENIGDKDFDVSADFLRPDERCHVNVIAIEARKQAELLFALRALMVHMNG